MSDQPVRATKRQQLDALRAWVRAARTPEHRAIRLIDTWVDDHLLCATVGLFHDGLQREVKVDLWWIGWEGVAAIKYEDVSIAARADLLTSLAPTIEGLEEEVDGDTCAGL